MIAELAMFGLGKTCTSNQFKFYLAPDNPDQKNGNDCGLFVCKTVLNILLNDSEKFSINTGEFRGELVNKLDNDVQITQLIGTVWPIAQETVLTA